MPESGPAVLISNHPTFLDPYHISFFLAQRWITWLAWDEAFDWPVVGAIMRELKALPLNMERPVPSVLKDAYAVLEAGRLLGMFFEGGRTKNGFDLDEPREGAARIALRAGVPVVPITISGARRAWPLERRLPRPGKIVITYHPPIEPEQVSPESSSRERRRELTERVATSIRSALPRDGGARIHRRPL